jgi:hypothetical protein
MAKKAQAASARKKTAKMATPKKAAPKKANAAKKAGALTVAAKRVGRTLGRAANGVDRITAAVKTSVSGKRGKKKLKIDPDVEATRARNRAMWKSQEQEATSIELSKHGTLVDERARVRANVGMSWSNRKPR